MIWNGFCGPSYKLDNDSAAPDETINYYLERIEQGPRAGQLRLRQIPGLRSFCTLPTRPVRGFFDGSPGRLFAVGGSQLYEIILNHDGVTGTAGAYLAGPGPLFVPVWTPGASYGYVGNGTNPAIITSNGFQLAIASAGLGYVTSPPAVPVTGQPLSPVIPIIDTQGQPLQAATMAFMDQYFIAGIQNSKQVRISNLAPAGAVWDPGDAAIKEADADNIQRVWVDSPGGELLFLFGQLTMEIWQNTGGLFPFTRVSGAVYPIGCDSAWSVAGRKGLRFWLWRGQVWGQIGTALPQRISDYGVEQAIKGYSYYDQINAEADCYTDGNHTFYSLSFIEAGETWVYDYAEKSWDKRLYWNNNQWNRYRPRLFAQQWAMNLGGDYETGDIYVLDPKVFTDAHGVPLRRDRIAPYITQEMKNVRFNRLTLDMNTGVGLSVAQNQPGWDPQIGMRYSKNRGKTWSNWRTQSLGKIGEDDKRVFFTQCGSARIGWTAHTSVTDPIDASINGAELDVKGGTMVARP